VNSGLVILATNSPTAHKRFVLAGTSTDYEFPAAGE